MSEPLVIQDIRRPARPEGWEARFYALINLAHQRGFHVRDWNCARFAHLCAEAVSGRELPYVWRGSLGESVDWLLRRTTVDFAQRGDIVLASVPEPSLGVCVGAHAAFVSAAGVQLHPMRDVSVAWIV